MAGLLSLCHLQRFGQWIWSCARVLRGPAAEPLRCCPIELLEPRALMSAGWDVALIDSNLPNVSILERAMVPGGHVITYNARTESPNEVLDRVISWAESTGSKIQSLSLLAHAAPGRFALGNEWVTRSTLPETALAWEALGRVMAPGGSINLYGCSLADPHGNGKALIDRIAYLAKAGVFANTEITGRGGDWVLDAAAKGVGLVSAHFVSMFNTAVLVTYPDSLGVLTGSASDSAAAVNLTTAGADDWIHGGYNGGAGIDVKASGGSQITNYSIVGSQSGASFGPYSDDPRPISWTDGSPDASYTETAGNGSGYLATGPAGFGFTLTAPADTTTRQLRVYVGGQNGGIGIFTAQLSDGSAANYTDTWTSSGNADRTYTLDYTAASAGQTLNLVPGPQATNQGSPLVFSYSSGNPLHVGDVASGGQVSVTLAARKGTITLSQTDGFTFVVGTGESNITMTFTGAIADVNAALEGPQFQPTDGYFGPALLRVTTVGLDYSSQGGPPRVESTVQIDVRPLVQPGGIPPPQVPVAPLPIPVSSIGSQGQPVTTDPIGPGDINDNPLNHRPGTATWCAATEARSSACFCPRPTSSPPPRPPSGSAPRSNPSRAAG